MMVRHVTSISPMPKAKVNFDSVRKIGLALPDVEETTMWGVPALKVRGKLLACVPSHKSAKPGSLVVRVDISDRAHLLEEAPEIYYLTDHYVGYSAVLVRLSCISEGVLRDLLGMAYKFVTSKPKRSSGSKKSKTARK
jgi:hypothetical protein